ncbi:MAG: phage holin [Pyramidobacter sp.]|nr:phage holin [Pyramidobacter sp.]
MKIQLNDRVYDVLKWVCLIALPAAGVLYAALAGLWGWPYTKEIVGTIAAVETFLGALLGLSTAQYNRENSDE